MEQNWVLVEKRYSALETYKLANKNPIYHLPPSCDPIGSNIIKKIPLICHRISNKREVKAKGKGRARGKKRKGNPPLPVAFRTNADYFTYNVF